VVLDHGKIAGIGTHSELMRECDVYREIAASQLSEDEAETGFIPGGAAGFHAIP